MPWALYKPATASGSLDAVVNLAVTIPEAGQGDAGGTIALLRKVSDTDFAIATFNLGVQTQQRDLGDPADAVARAERTAHEGEPRAHHTAAVLPDEGRRTPRVRAGPRAVPAGDVG